MIYIYLVWINWFCKYLISISPRLISKGEKRANEKQVLKSYIYFIYILTSEVYQEYAQALSFLGLLMLHHHLA